MPAATSQPGATSNLSPAAAPRQHLASLLFFADVTGRPAVIGTKDQWYSAFGWDFDALRAYLQLQPLDEDRYFLPLPEGWEEDVVHDAVDALQLGRGNIDEGAMGAARELLEAQV